MLQFTNNVKPYTTATTIILQKKESINVKMISDFSEGSVFTKTSQMASSGAIFTSTYHTKQLNPWPNTPASRVVNYSRLSACQGDM